PNRFMSDYAAYMALRRASDGYRPRPNTGNITLVLAQEECDLQSAAVWRTLIAEGVDVGICPGTHLTIVDEPHAGPLASLLEAAMRAAEAKVDGTRVVSLTLATV